MTQTSARFPELVGKTVVITGASRGIGLGIARAFVAQGAVVRLLADDPSVVDAAAGIGAIGTIVDITAAADVTDYFASIATVDVLINNAGLERLTPLRDQTAGNLSTFRRVLDINVTGTFIVTMTALPKMSAAGRIIVTASTWSRVGEPLFGAYVASKHALIGLIKTWARELGPAGITVNGVAPGWVRTEGSTRSLKALAASEGRADEDLMADILAGQAMPGLMEPDDIAGPYLYLASELAANVTGQTLGIDRGEVPW
jgi:NAD(P)-dependent dehydrogenase (short-subunit alcohol dehydrogenase family)